MEAREGEAGPSPSSPYPFLQRPQEPPLFPPPLEAQAPGVNMVKVVDLPR